MSPGWEPNRRHISITVFLLIMLTVPLHPLCAAPMALCTGSYSSTGMQSAVLTPLATP